MPTAAATPYWEHWYEVVQHPPFRQGDLLRGIVVVWPSDELQVPDDQASTQTVSVPAKAKRGDWIILDASCDLDQHVCPQVLLAPVEMATQQLLKAPDAKQFKERLEVMRNGGYPTKFLLSDHPNLTPPLPPSYVEFRHHVIMPLEYLESHVPATGILRLRSPLREKFGNWVGSCISRVGPEDSATIPKFTSSLHDAQRLRAATLDDPERPQQRVEEPRVFARIWAAILSPFRWLFRKVF